MWSVNVDRSHGSAKHDEFVRWIRQEERAGVGEQHGE